MSPLTRWLRRHVYRVQGHSMWPWAGPGDYLLIVACHTRHLRTGTVVVIEHPAIGVIVKRIERVTDEGHIALRGEATSSSASEALGLVHRDRIIGRVWHRVRVRPQPKRRSRPSLHV